MKLHALKSHVSVGEGGSFYIRWAANVYPRVIKDRASQTRCHSARVAGLREQSPWPSKQPEGPGGARVPGPRPMAINNKHPFTAPCYTRLFSMCAVMLGAGELERIPKSKLL